MPNVPGIVEPVPKLMLRVLRATVLEHASSENRRHHRPTLHAGLPGGRARRFEIRPDDLLDHALRVEVVEALCRKSLAQDVVPLLWLTRPEEDHDEQDAAWAAAVNAAGPELDVRLDLVVVTRRSWRDPRSGVGRDWVRLRPRDNGT